MKKNQSNKQTDPVDKKQEVQKSKDKHIDQDFEGYPHDPSREDVIDPKSEQDRNDANMRIREDNLKEESSNKMKSSENDIDEIESDGSAGAFSATEAFPGRFEDEDEDDEEKGKRNY
jgi:hypothetical protein